MLKYSVIHDKRRATAHRKGGRRYYKSRRSNNGGTVLQELHSFVLFLRQDLGHWNIPNWPSTASPLRQVYRLSTPTSPPSQCRRHRSKSWRPRLVSLRDSNGGYLDLLKAFNEVPYHRSQYKIKQLGTGGNIFKGIAD